MKKSFVVTAALMLLAGVCASCGKKEEKPKRMVVPKMVVQKPEGTQRQEPMTQTRVVSWMGRQYAVTISRTPDTSLPTVDDGTGVMYYDNRIAVSVARQDGSVFYERTFTKSDFAQYVEGASLKRRSLYAITLYKVSDRALQLVACVGSPDASSDDYQLMEISLSPDGAVSIKETTILDREDVGDGDDGVVV